MRLLPLKYSRVFVVCLCFVVWSCQTKAQVAEAKPVSSVSSVTPPAQAQAALVRLVEPLKSEAEVLAIIQTNKLWERKIPPEYRILRDRLPKDGKESIWSMILAEYAGKLDDIETNDFQFMDLPKDSATDVERDLSIEERLALSAMARDLKAWGNYMEVPVKMTNRLEVLATPESLRAWALEKIKASSVEILNNEFVSGGMIPTNQVPAAIRYLLPEQPFHRAVVIKHPQMSHVFVLWGSGRGFMGLTIGETNFQRSVQYTYSLNWVDGIAAWHGTGP